MADSLTEKISNHLGAKGAAKDREPMLSDTQTDSGADR